MDIWKFYFTNKLDEDILKSDKLQDLIKMFITSDEKICLAYKDMRDRIIFTDKKMILIDTKGITGKKKNYKIFPYSKISSFSVQTAGTLDFTSEFEIWLSGVGKLEIKFGSNIDIKEIGQIICNNI